MSTLSIAGDGVEWHVFRRLGDEGDVEVVRSRSMDPALREFTQQNWMLRLHCAVAATDSNIDEAHDFTIATDVFEDDLLAELQRKDARSFILAVVTGKSGRDYYFASAEPDDLLAAANAVQMSSAFSLFSVRMSDPKAELLNSLSP